MCPDRVRPMRAELDVVFVGINPGRYSGAVGHHFARPGNRFWRALHRAGFTDRELSPSEDVLLPSYGLGVTNLVARTTAAAADLGREELRRGRRALESRLEPLAPRFVAILGLGAYRDAFERPRATIGPQRDALGPSRLWLLPNPSGLNAGYQLPALADAFERLRAAVG